jgi:hypothetical protein
MWWLLFYNKDAVIFIYFFVHVYVCNKLMGLGTVNGRYFARMGLAVSLLYCKKKKKIKCKAIPVTGCECVDARWLLLMLSI